MKKILAHISVPPSKTALFKINRQFSWADIQFLFFYPKLFLLKDIPIFRIIKLVDIKI